MYHHGSEFITVLVLILTIFLTIILPYQLSVVIRCLRLVKKGGQHYIVPEEEINATTVENDGTYIDVIDGDHSEPNDSKL